LGLKEGNMNTSAEQLHHSKLNMNPEQKKDSKLFVDLDICSKNSCKDCEIKCSYLYHTENNGIASIRELANYFLVCRKCEEPHCVNACPVDALEQQKDKNKLLVRHNMRCISCKSCSYACPYGTIYPENLPYLIKNCDFCVDRREKEPLCISSCSYNAISIKTINKEDKKLDENTYLVGDNLVIHSTHWEWEKA
jgi:Fe-S-cluster-containing dehydrogenase component